MLFRQTLSTLRRKQRPEAEKEPADRRRLAHVLRDGTVLLYSMILLDGNQQVLCSLPVLRRRAFVSSHASAGTNCRLQKLKDIVAAASEHKWKKCIFTAKLLKFTVLFFQASILRSYFLCAILVAELNELHQNKRVGVWVVVVKERFRDFITTHSSDTQAFVDYWPKKHSIQFSSVQFKILRARESPMRSIHSFRSFSSVVNAIAHLQSAG